MFLSRRRSAAGWSPSELGVDDGPLDVLIVRRRPLAGQHSMEAVFDALDLSSLPGLHVQEQELPFASRGFLPRLRNILAVRRSRARVIHIAGDVHYVAVGLINRRVLLTVHDLARLDALRGYRRTIYRLLWISIPIRCSSLVTAISDATAEAIQQLVPDRGQSVRVVRNTISPAFRRTPIPTYDVPRVLQVGTRPNKNLARLIRALDGLEIHLRIVGSVSPSDREVLDGSDYSYSVVENLDDRAMRDEYRRASLVTFVSTSEGFGLPILEAQASGRPVITSALSPMREVAGSGAVLVDPYAESEIRAAVRAVLSDSSTTGELVERGFSNVERFSRSEVRDEYAEIYRELLSNGAPPMSEGHR